jgi:hypothetical protein
MDKIRVIVFSSDNGQNETVIFTQEFDTPTDDFLTPGLNMTLSCDEVIEDNLPSLFPREYTLLRRG